MGRALLAVTILLCTTAANAADQGGGGGPGANVTAAAQGYENILARLRERLEAERQKSGKAAPDKKKVEELQTAWQKELDASTDLAKVVRDASEQLTPLDDKRKALETALGAADGVVPADKEGTEEFKKLKKLREDIAEIKEGLALKEAALEKRRAAKLAAKTDLDKAGVESSADETKAADTLAKLKDHVERLNFDSSLSQASNGLENLGGQMSDLLGALETRVDNTVLGAYTREKMARLVSSPVFCKAQKACVQGDKPMSFDDAQTAIDDPASRMFFDAKGKWGGKRGGGATHKGN